MSAATEPQIASLATKLAWEGVGEHSQALTLLLDDSFEELDPGARETFLGAVSAPAWGEVLARCAACDYVGLARYQGQTCKACALPLGAEAEGALRLTFGQSAAAPQALEWEAPATFALAGGRSLQRALLIPAEEIDFEAKLAEAMANRPVQPEELLGWLLGGDPSADRGGAGEAPPEREAGPEEPLPPLPELELEGLWVLRFLSGPSAGESFELAPGKTRIGTGRSNEVQLKAKGIGFKHAIFHLDEGPSAALELEDLGTRGGSAVNDQPVHARGRRVLHQGDRVLLGSVEVQIGSPRPAAAAPPPPQNQVRRGGPPPSLGVDPKVLAEVLGEDALELAKLASTALPFERRLEGLTRQERYQAERDAVDFVELVRGVIDPHHLPEPAGDWLLWNPADDTYLARVVLESGLTLVVRCWELLARLPEPEPGGGPNRATLALSRLLADDVGRVLPLSSEPLAGGFFRCSFASHEEGLLKRRFESIEAISNGQVIAANFLPRFSILRRSVDIAEDPIFEASRALADRGPVWRPAPESRGPAAPSYPLGGRRRQRHLPRRS